MKKITIKFIESYPPYSKGETATFFEREANRLTDRGFAMYAGGDPSRDNQADRLRSLRGAPHTRHIPAPEATRHIPGPDAVKGPEKGPDAPEGTSSAPQGNRPAEVEGSGPKCGICRKPGHNRTNCPEK